MPQPSTVAQRLLAHARLCREIAHATLNEETACKLERMAEDCIRAAGDAEPAPRALKACNRIAPTRTTA